MDERLKFIARRLAGETMSELPGVWNLAQERLQDLRSLSAMRCAGTHRSRPRAQGTALSCGQRPNELWCADYQGEFLLGNRQYCYPLTVTDHASRYLLGCEALSSTCEDYAFTAIDWFSVGVDRMQQSLEPMRKLVEARQRSELTDVTVEMVSRKQVERKVILAESLRSTQLPVFCACLR